MRRRIDEGITKNEDEKEEEASVQLQCVSTEHESQINTKTAEKIKPHLSSSIKPEPNPAMENLHMAGNAAEGKKSSKTISFSVSHGRRISTPRINIKWVHWKKRTCFFLKMEMRPCDGWALAQDLTKVLDFHCGTKRIEESRIFLVEFGGGAKYQSAILCWTRKQVAICLALLVRNTLVEGVSQVWSLLSLCQSDAGATCWKAFSLHSVVVYCSQQNMGTHLWMQKSPAEQGKEQVVSWFCMRLILLVLVIPVMCSLLTPTWVYFPRPCQDDLKWI